jgi:dTMP kinase
MEPKGKIIVLEGLDGSGKSVQHRLLLEKLTLLGKKIASADFPDYDSFYGKLVARYLNGDFGDVMEVSPYISSLLYAEDRKDSATKLWNWLNNSYIILINRYASANMAYHSVKLPSDKRAEFVDWIKQLEYETHSAIPREDLVIFFNSEVAVAQSMVDRKEARNYTTHQRDIHERNSGYLAEVAQMYLQLCESEPHWVRLDVIDQATGNMYPPEQIHERVIAVLQNRHLL